MMKLDKCRNEIHLALCQMRTGLLLIGKCLNNPECEFDKEGIRPVIVRCMEDLEQIATLLHHRLDEHCEFQVRNAYGYKKRS